MRYGKPQEDSCARAFISEISNSQDVYAKRLTREPHQLIPSVCAHILFIGRVHRADEKSRRIHPIAALIQGYSCFTEILAYDKVCTEKSNDDIST